jgi:ankyrin repeat protein
VDQQAGAQRDGDTPLLLALRAANLQLVQLLLQHVQQVGPGGAASCPGAVQWGVNVLLSSTPPQQHAYTCLRAPVVLCSSISSVEL